MASAALTAYATQEVIFIATTAMAFILVASVNS
jgi:hypothetical protein